MLKLNRGEIMKIIKVQPRGYCKGVVRAIQIAKETRRDYPDKKITVLGMLVHNQYVVDALKCLNINTIEDKTKTRLELLDEIDEGIVLFTAHGVAQQVKDKAAKKGLICIDASCADVLSTQAIIKKALSEHKNVAYIGKKGHPEAEAVLSIDASIQLIELNKPLPKLKEPLFVTCQTTMSYYDVQDTFKDIQQLYPSAQICEEICDATRIRQQAVHNLENVTVLIVVGDRQSNNSTRLAEIGIQHGIEKVMLIDDASQLDIKNLSDSDVVAVTSGASTPSLLTNQVLAKLNGEQIEAIDLTHIL